MKKFKTASKKTLASFLALLTLFSFAAISASAETGGPAAPVCKLNLEDKTIVVEKPADGAEITIFPETTKISAADGSYVFINLVLGTTYTITASLGGKTASVNVSLLESQDPPETPTIEKRTARSIEVKRASKCEYKLTDAGGERIIYDWGQVVIFQNLDPDSSYTVYARKAEIPNNSYASPPSSVVVKTLKLGKTSPAAKPVLKNKTNVSITVEPVPGVEFSIDEGKTWINVCEFKNLSPNSVYTIIAREKFDPDEREPNPVSEPLTIVTNSRPSYQADLNKCSLRVTSGEKCYADENLKFTVKGDGPPDLNDAQYGDSRYVPKSYQSYQVGGEKSEKFGLSDNEYIGWLKPGEENANREIIITVTFVKQTHNGERWVDKGEVKENYPVKIGPVNDFSTKMKEFAGFILNVFLNDFPRVLSKLMEMQILSKFLVALGKLGKFL